MQARRVIRSSGVEVFYEDFDRTDLKESDLFRSLSQEHRYLGDIPVTVLTHLAICAELALPAGDKLAAAAAAHDLHEAYFRDLPTGLKDLLPEYRALEQKAAESIFRRLSLQLSEEEHAHLKWVDGAALLAEACAYRHGALSDMQQQLGRDPQVSHVFSVLRISRLPIRRQWSIVKSALQAWTLGGITWDGLVD